LQKTAVAPPTVLIPRRDYHKKYARCIALIFLTFFSANIPVRQSHTFCFRTTTPQQRKGGHQISQNTSTSCSIETQWSDCNRYEAIFQSMPLVDTCVNISQWWSASLEHSDYFFRESIVSSRTIERMHASRSKRALDLACIAYNPMIENVQHIFEGIKSSAYPKPSEF
jgi:hypothetical protein